MLNPECCKMTFHEFLAHLTHQRRLSEHTVMAYRTDLQQFATFCSAEYEVKQTSVVTREMIKTWLAGLMEQDLTAASIRRKLSALKAFYAYQQSRGLPTRRSCGQRHQAPLQRFP